MTSVEEQSSHQEKYLFDHIYIDHARFAHYYSQFSEIGLISGSKRIGKKIQKDQMKGQVNFAVAKGDYSGETTSEDGYEHQIDTSYTRPLETLSLLQEEGFIHNGLNGAGIGSLVKVTGSLSLHDTKLARDIYKDGSIMAMYNQASALSPKEKQAFIKVQEQQINSIDGVISKIPVMLQGNLSNENESCWFTLNETFLTIKSEDFAFKHGAFVQGEWSLLGILDAVPEVIKQDVVRPPMSTLQTALVDIQEFLRDQFGRAASTYGVTPIMIYRIIRPSHLPEYL